MLYRRPGTRFWWIKFEHAGQVYRRSTGTADRRRAQAEARRLRVEIEQAAGPGGRQLGVTLEILEALDTKRARDSGCSAHQIRAIGERWAPLLRHLGTRTDAAALNNATVPDYQGKRRREGVRGQTIRREVQALQRAINIAVLQGLIPSSPIRWDVLDRIPSDPADEAQKSKAWTRGDIDKVLRHLSKKAVRAGIRDLLRFAQLTGLRLEELRRYRRAWLRGRVLQVPAIDGAKTRESGAREIYLGKEAIAIAERRERFVIGKPNKALKLASQRAGFSVVLTPRDLRAFYITQVAKVDLLAAQKLAGHRNIATTSRYLHLDKASVRRAALRAAEEIEGKRRVR